MKIIAIFLHTASPIRSFGFEYVVFNPSQPWASPKGRDRVFPAEFDVNIFPLFLFLLFFY